MITPILQDFLTKHQLKADKTTETDLKKFETILLILRIQNQNFLKICQF